MKPFFPKTFILYPFLLVFLCFSCAPKYGAYFPKKTYDDNNYAKKSEEKSGDNVVVSINPVAEPVIEEIEVVDVELLESTELKEEGKKIKKNQQEVATAENDYKERGNLVLVEKQDRNATMSSREEMILDALKIKLNDMSRADNRAFRKEVKHLVKLNSVERLSSVENISSPENTNATDTNTLLLVIIAILLPPLAVFLYEGEINKNFWINLLLTLLFYIPGLIHALILIL